MPPFTIGWCGFTWNPKHAGTTVLGTPTMTSYGLFHQQQPESAASVASAATGRSVTTKNLTTAREQPSRAPRGGGGQTADGFSAAPAFEGASSHNDEARSSSSSSSAATNQHKRDLLERHTSAAKDGVIDMLTAKASKLGVSLERTLLAKREAEDHANKVQVCMIRCASVCDTISCV